MKKIFLVMAVLAAVLIGYAGCNQPNSSKTGNINTGNGGGIRRLSFKRVTCTVHIGAL